MAEFDAGHSARQIAPPLQVSGPSNEVDEDAGSRPGARSIPALGIVAIRRQADLGLIWIALAVGLAYAAYFVLRYGGLWTENDTTAFAVSASQTIRHGSILYNGQYSHGFGYSGWMASLSLLTGVPPDVLNTAILPYVGMALFIVPAFLAFRTLLGSERSGLLTICLFLAVPDLLFSVLRGNHEKLNISITLLALWVLFRGFEAMGRGSALHMAVWVITFYLLMTANACINDYFASTFVTASTITLITCAWLAAYRSPLGGKRQALFRYALTVSVSWLLMWWVVLFVFPPAGRDFQLITTTQGKLQSLFLTFQASSNPYAVAQQQWSGAAVSYAVSSFRYLLLIGSFVVFVVKGWDVVVNRAHLSLERLMLLALYGSFGFLVVVAIPVDLSGLSAGNNLEYRNFTYFILLATPLFAWGMRDALTWYIGRGRARPPHDSTPRARRSARSTLWLTAPTGMLLAVFVVIGLLKCTIDPLVSNQRVFYSSSEHQALEYYVHHSKSDVLWVGPDNLLASVIQSTDPTEQDISTRIEGYTIQPYMLDWFKSPQLIATALAYHFRLPDYNAQNRVYDNGSVQIFRVQPSSPLGW